MKQISIVYPLKFSTHSLFTLNKPIGVETNYLKYFSPLDDPENFIGELKNLIKK